MKRLYFLIFCLFISGLCNGQDQTEKFLIRQGFENVKHISANGTEFFYLESNAFSTGERLLNEVCSSVDSVSRYLEGNRINITVTQNRIPLFNLQGSDYYRGKEGKIIWSSGFQMKESQKVLRQTEKKGRFHNPGTGKIDILLYPQFRFRNTTLTRIYLFQININPTLETSLWRGSRLTAQVIIPLLNEYSTEESEIRPGYLTISQDFRMPGNIFGRITAGNFNQFRAGADLKLFKPVGERIGLYAQTGITVMSIPLFDSWYYSDLKRFTWKAGANFFYDKWNTMINLSFGKYLANDYSLRGDVVRYFKNASVGFYIQTIEIEDFPLNGGFFFSVALPPHNHKRNKVVRISTANRFNLEYLARPYSDFGRVYQSSPDESSSENFFNRMRLNQIIRNRKNR
ncbi:MAG: YjbH domain-containing protein [Bacteroidales bacterium]|jgi:hypothetical protein|nr:YjbH domain-containing protein [Bacteroidales bacterium]MDD2424494.1 YjbH domain-containing protein [Bacteroidales bacterium]MDD3988524.1 YjbH domain-containing protein [Bacteroidales bacterium]